MDLITFCSARRSGPPHAPWGRGACAVALLLAAVLIGGSACAAGTPARPRVVILLLSGARLDDICSSEMPHLSDLVRRSAGAWVAAWKQFDLASQPGVRLRIRLRRDPQRPFGVSADGAAIDRLARATLRSTDLLWIDPGDLERAERYAPLCLPAKAREHRTAALRGADELLASLLHDTSIRDLWVLAPPLKSGPGLTPFFWWRRGDGSGLLRSGSTHMIGVVTGADVAATLAWITGTAYTGGGCRATVVPEPELPTEAGARYDGTRNSVEALRRLGALAERTDRLRAVANYGIEWLLLLLVGAGAMALHTGRRIARPLALAPLLLPALLLLDGARRGGVPLADSGILLLIVAGLVGAYSLRRQSSDCGLRIADCGLGDKDEPGGAEPSSSLPPNRNPGCTPGSLRRREPLPAIRNQRDWSVLAATTVGACAVAVLAGNLFRWAILGHSIRLGVRFYGVGNEFMGWWIGAAVLAAGVPDHRRVRPGAIGLLIGVALLIGHPGLGGKVGGVITGLAALAVEAWPFLRRHRALAALALGVAGAALLGLAAWDASQPPDSQTHLGRLALRVAAEGPRPFLLMARGKLLTELRLTLGLWGALLAAGVWLILEARQHAPEAGATRAVSRLLPVAAVAFLCNDSGVIAAALMLSYGALAAGKAGSTGASHQV